MYRATLATILFTFVLISYSQPSNDDLADAIDVSGLINSCSADAVFTTNGATPDMNAGSCWDNSGPQLNVWFSFVATTSSISVTVDRGGSKGTQQRSQIAIWESDGSTEIACKRYQLNGEDVVVDAAGSLTIGDTYYISVDTYSSSYRGSFSLCLSDVVSYDFLAGAIDVTGIINGCSSDQAYSTIGGSPDQNAGSCWNSGPEFNRWFSFVATSTASMSVTVDRGGTKGSQQRTQIALWEADGITEVACKKYQFNGEDVVLEALGVLTSGNTYFISVDSYNSSYDGTFTLCLSDVVSYDYLEGAVDVSGFINGCSADEAYTTIGGSADRNTGSCWDNTGPKFNKWFSFVATTTSISVTVDIGDGKGTQQRSQVALWEADGVTEIACKRYQLNGEDVSVDAIGMLNIGDTYYISVDTYDENYDGTFTLCLEDEVSYDYYEGAVEVTDINNWCSSDAEYSTIGGTADKNAGDCWDNSGPQFNRWFSFDALSDGVSITVDRGDEKGTQQRTEMALWESDGTTQVACERYAFNGEDVSIQLEESLTQGNTYYISVDTYSSDYDGTFTLCIDDNPSNDYYEGAYEISDINNWCSTDAEFTTVGGTPDLNAGGCWDNSGPIFNKWFYFVAVTDGISITVERGGAKGTQQRTQLALWEADGTTEVACSKYEFDTQSVSLESIGSLTQGDTYYISVDSYSLDYDGTFTICVDDTPSNDFYGGAYEITNLSNWCSSDAEFTTIGGTADLNVGSCWDNSGPQKNKWFWFTAIGSDIDISVDVGSGKGTQLRTQLALWESDGTTQLDCSRYSSDPDDVAISYSGLTIGNEYYLSVDTYSESYDGSFTLCVSNINETFYSINDGAWDNVNNWSTTGHSGSSGSFYPQAGDVVYIEGNIITVDANQSATQVNINVDNAATGLTIDGATLDVNGQFNFTNSGNNYDGTLSIINGGSLNIQDDMNMTRGGGANTFDLSVSGNSSVVVNNDLIITSTGGLINNNTISLSNLGSLTVSNETTFNTLSGVKTQLTLNDDASFTANQDISFVATGSNLVEIEVNNDAVLNLGASILRGTPAYGILDVNDNGAVAFNSINNLQVWPATAGESPDGFNYINVIVNNARTTFPQVTLEGDVEITGTLSLTDGIVESSAGSLLTLAAGAGLTGGSDQSFIDGPLRNIGNESFEFPIGDGDVWAPIEVSGLTGGDGTTSFTAEYTHDRYPVTTVEVPDLSGEDLDHISILEYWDLEVSGSLISANVTLHWKDASRSEIGNYSDLRIAHFDAGDSEWENYGTDATSSSDPGSITVNNISDFSPLTFGTITRANPLPVELAFIKTVKKDDQVELQWGTYSETNNDVFVVERSRDGHTFSKAGEVPGKGTTSDYSEYYFRYAGIGFQEYLRLSQVDFDGTIEFLGIIQIRPTDRTLHHPLLYPNPSNGQKITIDLHAGAEVTTIEIYDLVGKLLHYYSIENQQYFVLPADLNNGSYMVKITTNSASSEHLLVVN